jgi:anti-sigma regulatory factor (Ser/Thr protein kinase)
MDGRRRSWRLRAIDSSVTTLRRELTDSLRGAALSPDERNDLLLVTCEAVGNAVEHPRDSDEPSVDVLSEIGDARVTVVVRDHGHWRETPSGVHRGRGLATMWILADTIVAPGPRGTTVTIRSSPRHGRHPSAR